MILHLPPLNIQKPLFIRVIRADEKDIHTVPHLASFISAEPVPSANLCAMAFDMFRDIWNVRLESSEEEKHSMQRQYGRWVAHKRCFWTN